MPSQQKFPFTAKQLYSILHIYFLVFKFFYFLEFLSWIIFIDFILSTYQLIILIIIIRPFANFPWYFVCSQLLSIPYIQLLNFSLQLWHNYALKSFDFVFVFLRILIIARSY